MLNPTPVNVLLDERRRPYFLWDVDVTLDELRARLADPDEDVRAYWLGKVMRQAKPDDVLQLVRLGRITEEWPRVERYLGRSRPFWAWLIHAYGELGDSARG